MGQDHAPETEPELSPGGSSPEPRFEVAIVGYGPVGQLAAILLGRRGHRVAVFERWPELYPRPRAVHYDDEIARVFQSIGIAEQLRPITEPAMTYEWRNADGQTLLMLDRGGLGPSGWPAATMFRQPDLELLLDKTAKRLPNVRIYQGWEAAELSDVGSVVGLLVRQGVSEEGMWKASGEEREVLADYVIGCDGANSLVREAIGTPVEDLGFAYDWLIADTIPRDPGLLAGVNLQRCDPARPTTMVSGGPGRRRWEWMLLPGETREQVEQPEFVWELLAESGITDEDVSLERHAVYTFRARWAEQWRVGRMLIAGDAAHLMPPFAGQGMCSGVRDAFSLAWHLDLVLRRKAAPEILDAYSTARLGHLRHAISFSVELGKIICITDAAQAAARDEALLPRGADPSALPIAASVPLGPGMHDEPPAEDTSNPAGSLFPQGLVAIGGRTRLLEDEAGVGFTLYAHNQRPASLLDEETIAYLQTLGASLVGIDDSADIEGVYGAWFELHDCVAALVRPDFYVFAAGSTAEEIRRAVKRLEAALTASETHQERVKQ